MLGPFNILSFTEWCQVKALLTRPRKDSQLRRVMMEPGSLTSLGHTPQWSVLMDTH